MKIIEWADMSQYCSFKVGGLARRLLIPESREEVIEAVRDAGASDDLSAEPGVKNPYIILGNGTNTIFACEEYNGTVILIGDNLADIHVDGERITCEAGALLSKFARTAQENALTGAEFASGIPGSIGGAVYMNAGAYDGEIKNILEEVELLVPGGTEGWEIRTLKASLLNLGYRSSALQENGGVVLSATFTMRRGNKDEIQAKMQELNRRRVEKQPLEYPSAGSFFKRPEGHFTGKLIQDAGLAGLSYGGARISEKHCGFMVNAGGATYEDVITLMHLVQNTVYDKFGVRLEPEIRIIDNI